MPLFLYLMTTSLIMIMANDGAQLMSLLDGSLLKSSRLRPESKLKDVRRTSLSSQSDRNTTTTIENFNCTLPNTDISCYETEESNFKNSTGHAPLKDIQNKRRRQVTEFPLKVNLFLTRWPQFGKVYSVFVTMPSLGNEIFVLNITVDTEDYLIDEIVTRPGAQQKEWRYTNNLAKELRRRNLVHKRLPYTRCFFYRARATFYNTKHEFVIARVSLQSARDHLLAAEVHRKITVRRPPEAPCMPMLHLRFCQDPNYPIEIWARGYLIFEAIIRGECKDVQHHGIRWDFYDLREKNLVQHVDTTKNLVLKLKPYTTYKVGVLFVMHACATINDVVTVARCYLKYNPPRIEVLLKGNERRRVDVRKKIILDASDTKDRTMVKESLDNKNFIWSCSSEDDASNSFCRKNMSIRPILRLPKYSLKKDCVYNFSVAVSHISSPLSFDTGSQLLLGLDFATITPEIVCRRNCQMGMYAPIDSVHLTARCMDCKERIVRYEWWVKADDEDPILESQKNYLILRHQEDTIFIILWLEVKSKLSGASVVTLRRNDGPQNGSCTISPKSGIESVTTFRIECKDFQTPFVPLFFRYHIPVTGLVAQARLTRYSTLLLSTDVVLVTICDILDMCVKRELNVKVRPYQLENPEADLEDRIMEIMSSVPQMLQRGDWNKAMVRSLAATEYVRKAEHCELIYSHIRVEEVYSTPQLEKLTVLATQFLANLIPVDYRGAMIMADIFNQMSRVFLITITEKDWLKRDAYNTITARHMFFMSSLGYGSEKHSMAMCRAYDPECLNARMLELDKRYAIEFDPLILYRINNWMLTTWYLYLCVYYLGVLATLLHNPYDEALTVLKGGIAYQVNVTEVVEPIEDITLRTIDRIHDVVFSANLLRELSKSLKHTTILLQTISQQNYHNIFWWYPDPMPSKTSVIIIHACSSKNFFKSAEEFQIENPVVYRTNISRFNDDRAFRKWMSNGSISHSTEVHYYSLMLDAKAMLAVRIVSCSEPMYIKMRMHKRPPTTELQHGACLVKPNMKGKRMWMRNSCDRSEAFVAISRPYDRPSQRIKRDARSALNYSILLEIYQCYGWSNRSLDPGWSSDLCNTSFENSYGTSVQCTCVRLGALASRIFPILAEQYVDVRPPPELITQLEMLIIFLILLLYLIAVLAMSFGVIHAHQKQVNFLQCEGGKIKIRREKGTEAEVLLVIVTGGQEFAGTTSNIKFYLKSPHRAQTTYQITQDPGHPKLLRNTTNKLVVPKGKIQIPTRLALGIERNGRYPSWYCRTVTVVDLELKRQQLFVVERWLHYGHTRFIRSEYFSMGEYRAVPHYTWWKRFRNRIEQLQSSWYMGNPTSGPWQNSIGGWTMNRLERTAVLISKVAISITMVSLYYGKSSVEELQEEFRIYGSNYVRINIVAALSFYSFVAGCLVHIFFELVILRRFSRN